MDKLATAEQEKMGAAYLTAEAVSPSPSRVATAAQVSADGLRFAEVMARSSMRRSRSAVHWYGIVGGSSVFRIKTSKFDPRSSSRGKKMWMGGI